MTTIQTSDLFLSAYLITNNIRPTGCINSGKKVLFLFPSTPQTRQLTDQFRLGSAVTNVLDLKKNVQYVRDLMFDTLRAAVSDQHSAVSQDRENALSNQRSARTGNS